MRSLRSPVPIWPLRCLRGGQAGGAGGVAAATSTPQVVFSLSRDPGAVLLPKQCARPAAPTAARTTVCAGTEGSLAELALLLRLLRLVEPRPQHLERLCLVLVLRPLVLRGGGEGGELLEIAGQCLAQCLMGVHRGTHLTWARSGSNQRVCAMASCHPRIRSCQPCCMQPASCSLLHALRPPGI